jgi:ChaB protein/Rho termination factor-like protein
MPKTNKDGSAKQSELPSTIARSDELAQRTFAKTYDSATESYGDGERAARTAFSSLKHTHEKVGDHWEPKEEHGPSDDHAAEGRTSPKPTEEGVDARASKQHLYDVAKRLEVEGRSRMTKDELVEAIKRANRKATAEARSND